MKMIEPSLRTGSHGDYDWLTSEHELDVLLRLCPEVVIGKHVAITSIDSGFLHLTTEQRSSGWESIQNIAYSPLISSVNELPHCGFDEWYVLDELRNLGQACNGNVFESDLKPEQIWVFVNYFGFALDDPQMRGLVDLFWKQLDLIQPESYVADGSRCLSFVTRRKELFTAVREALAAEPLAPCEDGQ